MKPIGYTPVALSQRGQQNDTSPHRHHRLKTKIQQRRERDVYGVLNPYVDAVLCQDAIPILIPLGIPTETLCNLYNRTDGLILSGGGDVHPENYGNILKGLCKQIDPDRDRLECELVQ